MTMLPDPTGQFYADNAQTYVLHADAPSRERLDPFLALLSQRAEILELGCGNGRDSGEMLSRGFRVTPTDGIVEIAAEAAIRLAMPVSVLRFGEIDFVSAFTGRCGQAAYFMPASRPGRRRGMMPWGAISTTRPSNG